MKTYYTVVIPYSDKPTAWHPTDKTGPFAVLSRGAFESSEAAHAWAQASLEGQPYSVAPRGFDVPETTTLAHALGILAYHIGEIMGANTRVRVHFFGGVTGDYTFDDPGDFDREYTARFGTRCSETARNAEGHIIGNRCAARNDYVARCAPVLAFIAARELMLGSKRGV